MVISCWLRLRSGGVRYASPGIVKITGWLRRDGAGRLARWLKSHTPPPLSACCHPARCVALPALSVELPRRGGSARRPWARPLIRNHPELGAEVRTDDGATATAEPSPANQPVAICP